MANTNSEIKLLSKNTELNNILKDYSIVASTNSYILNYYANLYTANYSKIEYLTDPMVISEFLTLNTNNRINNYSTNFQEKIEFNFETTYSQSDKMIAPNSLIISNLTNEDNITYENSYLVFYNTSCGLKQLTYHYKEGNGLYYDQDNHIFGMNIDNKCIKEINKKLFFDTNSIPISSQDNYGIAYIDNKYLKINNGILTIDQEYIENVISYKYKIKNLFDSLSNIYNSLAYYNNIYDTKDNALDEFTEAFSDVSSVDDNGNLINKSIKTQISYHNTSSLYFPKNEIKYIDNYYFSNGLIEEKYKQFIELNEENSYIIYCKDLEQIEIYSYIENEYINYGKIFNVNKLRSIESQLDQLSIIDISTLDQSTDYTRYVENNDRQEILNSNNIYSYIYLDESNNYNKFVVKPNIISKLLFSKPTNLVQVENNSTLLNGNDLVFIQRFHNDSEYYEQVDNKYVEDNFNETFFTCSIDDAICYQMTKNKIKFNNTFIDEKLFKKLGIILNSKMSLPEIKKNIIEYVKNDKAIKYDYTIQHINCRYDNRNIKILYDDRNISYCSHNLEPIPYNKDNYYFLSDYQDMYTRIEIPITLAFMLKNIDISFDNRLKYLFYGYNIIKQNDKVYNKDYYAIWHDLPTCFVIADFMRLISNFSNQNKIIINNFKELYTENFNEVPFHYGANSFHKLYLYKLYSENNKQYIEKVNNITIDI